MKDDVVSKLTILQAFVDKDSKESPHYDTIQKAIDYEAEHNLIKTNSENFPRTLLRLHRALIFIEEFLRGLSDRPASDSAVSIATHAYDSTLYHHRKSLLLIQCEATERKLVDLLKKFINDGSTLSVSFVWR